MNATRPQLEQLRNGATVDLKHPESGGEGGRGEVVVRLVTAWKEEVASQPQSMHVANDQCLGVVHSLRRVSVQQAVQSKTNSLRFPSLSSPQSVLRVFLVFLGVLVDSTGKIYQLKHEAVFRPY